MTGPRADDCAEVNGPHPKHLPVCQRAGYANGLADGRAEAVAELYRRLTSAGHVGGALFVVRSYTAELAATGREEDV